jgi:D-alanyl-D-alanine carboxypeptidase (penicillin-binding protein 5/6)
MMKFIIVLILLGIFGATVKAQQQTESAATPAYILIESSTGQVLRENNADEKMPPASLTKIMLLLLVAEEINAGRLSLDEQVTASSYASSRDGSVIWLEPGEMMTVDDLVKSVVISSANDSAVALAEHIAGSEAGFVALMNQKAFTLGMSGTNFTNTVGYDEPQHYTTARDVAAMSRALMREENYGIFGEYMLTRLCSVRTGTARETQLLNTNKMITCYNGIMGIKTGTTDNAGYCLSAAATRNDMQLISVVMGCADEDSRVNLSQELLDYGFGGYELYHSAAAEKFDSLTVRNGVLAQVPIVQLDVPIIVIPKGRAGDIVYEIYLPEQVTAPLNRSQPVGTITARLDENIVYESYVVSAVTVERLTFWRILGEVIRGFFWW